MASDCIGCELSMGLAVKVLLIVVLFIDALIVSEPFPAGIAIGLSPAGVSAVGFGGTAKLRSPRFMTVFPGGHWAQTSKTMTKSRTAKIATIFFRENVIALPPI